jgi:hypothetical protein
LEVIVDHSRWETANKNSNMAHAAKKKEESKGRQQMQQQKQP